MTHMQHVRRLVGILTGLAASLVAAIAIAPSAFAMVDPPPGGPLSRFEPQPVSNLHHPQVPVHTTVAIGMPGWQIALIAVGAAIVAAALAVLIDRAFAARRHPAPTHA
jgi:hypothetical protein